MKEQKHSYSQRIGKDNIHCKCKAVGKCEEAFEYGVSGHLQSTRFWATSFSGQIV